MLPPRLKIYGHCHKTRWKRHSNAVRAAGVTGILKRQEKDLETDQRVGRDEF